MNPIERRDKQIPYISDASMFEEQVIARGLPQKLNTMDCTDFAGSANVVKELFGGEYDGKRNEHTKWRSHNGAWNGGKNGGKIC